MNSVNLVATLAIDPTEAQASGDKVVWAEVYLRPSPDDEVPPFPDRLRIIAKAGSASAVRLQESTSGETLAISGSLRRSRSPVGRAADIELLVRSLDRLSSPR